MKGITVTSLIIYRSVTVFLLHVITIEYEHQFSVCNSCPLMWSSVIIAAGKNFNVGEQKRGIIVINGSYYCSRLLLSSDTEMIGFQ